MCEDQEDEGAGVVMARSCGIYRTVYRFGRIGLLTTRGM